jgi:DNA-binding transcriptional LysR family regulator
MRDGSLATLEVFLVVAAERSFRRAAGKLGITPSAVSHSVRRLEERVGTALLARTTRSVRLTDAGERLAARVGPALREAALALEQVPVRGRGAAGVLRLNVPRIAMELVVSPALPAFLAANPDASIEVSVDDKLVDIVAAGYDAGIRFRESLSDGMIATRVSKAFRFVVVGAPAYLKEHGRPRTIDDLADHECIGMRFSSGVLYRWELERDGKELEVPVRGRARVILQSMTAAMDAALRGLGLAYVDEPSAAEALKHGKLEIVLESAAVRVPGLFLYYPRSAKTDPKIRAFAAACRKPAAR